MRNHAIAGLRVLSLSKYEDVELMVSVADLMFRE